MSRYDGAGRVVEETYEKNNSPQWSTRTSYGGNYVTVIPPAGGTPTRTYTDAAGQQTELREYTTADIEGPSNSTKRTYTKAGKLATMTDAIGNTWTTSYDLAGNATRTTDPDKGATTMTYDYLNHLLTSTDARNKTLVTLYDKLGRKYETHEDTKTGPMVGAWSYDKVKKGQLDATTRYVGADKYIKRTTVFDDADRPTEVELVLPQLEGTKLPTSFKTITTYLPDDPTGNVTQINTTASGADRQCFTYDGLRRLTEAWTSTQDCGAVGAAVGGAAPYWKTYGYDAVGRRESQTLHGLNGTADAATTTAFPAVGEPRPHAPKSVSTSGPLRMAAAGDYTYDDSGNTKAKPGGQSYEWDNEGHLASATANGVTTSYVNTLDNERLVAKSPGGTTLYVASGELKLDKASGNVTATRYYLYGGQAVAARTSKTAVSYLINDNQGTANLTVDATSLQPAKRRFDPFGVSEGPVGVCSEYDHRALSDLAVGNNDATSRRKEEDKRNQGGGFSACAGVSGFTYGAEACISVDDKGVGWSAGVKRVYGPGGIVPGASVGIKGGESDILGMAGTDTGGSLSMPPFPVDLSVSRSEPSKQLNTGMSIGTPNFPGPNYEESSSASGYWWGGK